MIRHDGATGAPQPQDEAPEVDWLPEEVWGKIMSDEDVLKALDYQFSLK